MPKYKIKDCPFCGLPVIVNKKIFRLHGLKRTNYQIQCGAVSEMECFIRPYTSYFKRLKDAVYVWHLRSKNV